MENISKEYTRARRDFDIYTDTSADYSLPDYNGDIKRVLYTSAEVSPTSKFNEDEDVCASGIVTYDIIYLNSENEIDHISFTSDYDVSAKLRSENTASADIETRVSAFSHRLFGPRRINMKASLTSEVRVIETAKLETEVAESLGEDIECIMQTLEVKSAAFAHSREREYADAITSPEGVSSDEVEIVHTAASCIFDEVKAELGGVKLSGDFIVSELIKCGDTAPILYKKKIPFEEFIECEDVKPEMSAVAYANISSISSSVTPLEGGVSITASIIADYGVRAYGNCEISVMRDAYLKTMGSEGTYENLGYNTHLGTERRLFSATHTLPLNEICDGGIENVIYTSATGKLGSIEIEDGAVKINAELKLQGFCSRTDEHGEESYHGVKCSFQTTEKVKLDCHIPDDAIIECKIRALDSTATIDESNMYIEVLYAVDMAVEASGSTVRLSALTAKSDEVFEKRESEIIVYYPKEDDTLFSIAKAYHTSTRRIAADNMLTESVMKDSSKKEGLAGIKKLLIK